MNLPLSNQLQYGIHNFRGFYLAYAVRLGIIACRRAGEQGLQGLQNQNTRSAGAKPNRRARMFIRKGGRKRIENDGRHSHRTRDVGNARVHADEKNSLSKKLRDLRKIGLSRKGNGKVWDEKSEFITEYGIG